MVSKTMTASAIDRFIRSMEEQGVGVTRTTKGLLLRLPDGESTSLHFTNSDVRAPINLMSRLRRAGVRHPDDPKDVRELPSNITDAPPVAERSRRRLLEVVEQMGWPEVVTVKEVVDLTDMVHITVTRTLYQMGFTPVKGKRGARDWLTPEDVLAMKPEPEPEPELEEQFVAAPESPTFHEGRAEEAERLLNEAMATAKPHVEQSDERILLDSHESWVIDDGAPDVYVPNAVRKYLSALRGAGLEVEIRVWRNV